MSKKTALVVLHGGPYDGRTLAVASHDELDLLEDGAYYVRQDQQEGDYRVYRFAVADGEALPTTQSAGPEQENLLHRDLAQQNEIYEPGSGYKAPPKAAKKA